jgi:hypothetical protein
VTVAPSSGVSAILVLLLATGGIREAAADENGDLNLIPDTVNTPTTPAPPTSETGNQRVYLENAFTGTALRDGLAVPFPPPDPPDWQERLFLDTRAEWNLGSDLQLTFSDRFNLSAQEGRRVEDRDTAINDFREGYLGWRPFEGGYLDLGRINLKSGVALGTNPTDFFKTRAVVEPLSSDPSVLREDRLGTLMVRGQYIWSGGAVTAAFAPKIAAPSAIGAERDPAVIDPLFDRTNAATRFLLKADLDLADDFSPEFLVYRQGTATRFGFNLTESIGQSLVLYAEWSGGRRRTLIDEALRYGRRTGTIPDAAPYPLPPGGAKRFRNEAALGASYTVAAKITFNLEYHYNEAGFSGRDWRRWFDAGGDATAAPTLWYIRSYASDQQEPVGRHSVFLRADWPDAFTPDLDLTGFVNVDLADGSGLAELTADYHLSDAWTVGGIATATVGGAESDFGSLPNAASFMVHLNRDF